MRRVDTERGLEMPAGVGDTALLDSHERQVDEGIRVARIVFDHGGKKPGRFVQVALPCP